MSNICVSEQEKRELEKIIKSIPEKERKEAIIYWDSIEMYVYAGNPHDDIYFSLPNTLEEKAKPVVKQVLSNVPYFYFADFLKHFCPELAKMYY